MPIPAPKEPETLLLPAVPGELLEPLDTARLRLTPLIKSDAERLSPVLADASLYTFMGGSPPDETDLRARFASWERRYSPDSSEMWLNWTVALQDSETAVGYVQATVLPGPLATLAYVVGTRWQRQGIASEAARAALTALRDVLAVHHVRAEIAVGHQASEGVARALGLQRTGELTPDGEMVWEAHVP
jgi:RimJ/RimL family protein N-acetyltransferase